MKRAVEITPDIQDEFATVAQAEGVSLSVARRLMRVVAGSRILPSVPSLGRVTLEAGQRAGQLLGVLDAAARPKVEQGVADEISWAENRVVSQTTRMAAVTPFVPSGSSARRFESQILV